MSPIPNLAGKRIEVVIVDEAETIPEVECERCESVTPLKSSTWCEHDPHHVGWWCHACRVAAGFDVPTVHFNVPYVSSHADAETWFQRLRHEYGRTLSRVVTHGS